LPAPARLACARSRDAGRCADGQGHEIVVGNRVFVLFPQVPLAHQQIGVRRVRVGGFALEQRDGVDVLLAAEDQLLFLLALGHLSPDWHGHREHDRHDAHGDQEDGHRVAAFVPSLTR
jgi:hypothetical protein